MKLYVERDKNGMLYLYTDEVIKRDDCWTCSYPDEKMVEIDNKLFPNVKWEDNEPTEVELIIKKKILMI